MGRGQRVERVEMGPQGVVKVLVTFLETEEGRPAQEVLQEVVILQEGEGGRRGMVSVEQHL